LITFAPTNAAEEVRQALFSAGAGSIGNYDNCSFTLEGTGSFKGNEASNPTLGKRGELHFEKETQIGVTFAKHLKRGILKALFEAHPYEEVAYEVYSLENVNQKIGMGMIGELEEAVTEEEFLAFVKKQFSTGCIRH